MIKLKFQRIGDVCLGVLLSLVIFNGSAMATAFSEVIEVSYIGITMYINGEKTTIKDTNGTEVEPFVYKGTTYVPLAFVSTSLGQNVTWDGETKTIYIGNSPESHDYLMTVCPPYETNYGYYSANGSVTDGSSTFNMAGKTYTNGFMMDMNKTNSTELLFNLDGKYESMTFTAGHIDGKLNDNAHIFIYLDGKLAMQLDLTAEDLPQDYVLQLDNALQMKIVAKGELATFWGSHYAFANILVS